MTTRPSFPEALAELLEARALNAQGRRNSLYDEPKAWARALALYDEAVAENVCLRNVVEGDEEQLKRIVNQNGSLRDALVERQSAIDLERQVARAEADRLREALRATVTCLVASRKLNAAYRTGGRPSEATLDTLASVEEVLANVGPLLSPAPDGAAV
jgi:hypothetical protein